MQKNEDCIAIYSRKSKFTGKGESIGNQIELCKEYIRMHYGDDMVSKVVVYEDEGFSGGNLNRPDFRNMMEAAQKHRFQAVIVYRLDRISRNISDFSGLIEELSRLNIAFVSIKEQFDTGTPMGRAMMYIASVFSQLERETIAERIRDNMHELAKTGRWLGGNTPTGFTSESTSTVTMDGKTRKACRLKLIPAEFDLVRTIFDLYTETDSLTATEAELLRRRLKSKTGKDFTRFAIRAILRNPVYMTADGDAWRYFTERGADVCSPQEAFDGTHGVMPYNRTEQEKGRNELPVSEWIIAVGKHPGMISSAQWIRIQESLERNKSKSYRKSRQNEALLTGLLFCTCGERMYPKLSNRHTTDGARQYSYVCKRKERSRRELCSSRNANGNVLDAMVMEQISRLGGDGILLSTRLEKNRRLCTDSPAQNEIQLSDLQMEYAENERKMTGLVDDLAILDDAGAKIQIVKRIGQLHEANHGIEQRIRELETRIHTNTITKEEFERLRQLLATFGAITAEMTLEEKRSALRHLVHKVIWDGTNAHVVLFGADEAASSEL